MCTNSYYQKRISNNSTRFLCAWESTHSKDSLLDVAAYPESVNVIEGVDNDVRTPDKLVDGVNDTADGHHMWLAPILPNQVHNPVKVSLAVLR